MIDLVDGKPAMFEAGAVIDGDKLLPGCLQSALRIGLIEPFCPRLSPVRVGIVAAVLAALVVALSFLA